MTASNGTDVSSYDVSNHIDIVITDILMPEQDGFETMSKLKKAAPRLKMIAMSCGGYFEP